MVKNNLISEDMLNNLIILDRDGVINKNSKEYIKNKDEWVSIQGSIKAISKLYNNGFKIVIVTNQSGIGRGLFSEIELREIHLKMTLEIESHGGSIEGIYFCPHKPDDNCICRKPKIGLIKILEDDLKIKAKNAILIGDSHSDIVLANSIEALPILVKTGNGKETLSKLADSNIKYLCFESLEDATEAIIKKSIIRS
tara:strand:- start:95245 stop:95835 length:591 start_codon:yes stop_codon:yes gene_type:complete